MMKTLFSKMTGGLLLFVLLFASLKTDAAPNENLQTILYST